MEFCYTVKTQQLKRWAVAGNWKTSKCGKGNRNRKCSKPESVILSLRV